MKIFKKSLALLLILLTFFLSSCKGEEATEVTTAKEVESFHGVVFPLAVYSDIVVEEASLRTAEFPEDGSFEKKENVLVLKVKNESVEHLQMLRLKVTTDKKEMFFDVTTLPVNMSVNVFEKNGQTLSEDEKIISITGEIRADFQKPIGLQRETFSLDVHDRVINVKNISKTDIDTVIYLYYKKKDSDGSYLGGITFRSKIEGLKAGELKQIPASHFMLADSEVIFLDYAVE